MAFKKVGMVRRGLMVGGYSVAKYEDKETGQSQLRLMRNGRAIARKQFNSRLEFAGWYLQVVPAYMDGPDAIVALSDALK